MKQIGVKNVKLSEYEMSIAAHLVDPLNMHVCMLSDLIKDLGWGNKVASIFVMCCWELNLRLILSKTRVLPVVLSFWSQI